MKPIRRALNQAANPLLSWLHRSEWRDIEARRTVLLNDTTSVKEIDYGAGDPTDNRSAEIQRKGVQYRAPVAHIASASKPPKSCRTLYYLARLKRPTTVLELGTCVGISAAYLSRAIKRNGNGHVWTIEGSRKVADIALQTLSNLNLSDVASVICGPFHETLRPVLADRTFDFVFVDGHHDGPATIKYFEQIKQRVRPGAIVLFDDIEWSPGMATAWVQIKADPSIADTTTKLGVGFCVMH